MNPNLVAVLKFLAALSMFGAWCAFAWFDKTMQGSLVAFVSLVLTAWGTHTVVTNRGSVPPQSGDTQ